MLTTLRLLAAADIDAALTYYRSEAGQGIASDFVDDLESAIRHIINHPLTGSLRFAYELEIPELRSWPLKKYPNLVYYVTDETSIDIWRLLHTRRDVPEFLNVEPPE
ncbi:MAG: type II toxin-antitoxin system RelE/ParE family toxin [Acidimicrobiales bacterium]